MGINMNFEEYYDILIKEANDERNIYYNDNIKDYGDYPVIIVKILKENP